MMETGKPRGASGGNDREPIPFHLVTGFLGAGKTTAINRLLRAREFNDALIIVNEWGEVGIDHLLYERLSGEAVLLNSGCVCCALRGDLVECLYDLLERRDRGALPPFSRIILETTGLAEPAPILYAVIADPALADRLTLSGVTTLVDAVNGLATIHARPENARQIALADRLVITKSDLLPPAKRSPELAALLGALRGLNPVAPIVDGAAGEFTPLDFLSAAAPPSFPAAPPPAAHSSSVRAYAFRTRQNIEPRALSQFLALLSSLLGPRLLRLKGIVALADRPDDPALIEGAQHVFHAPRFLGRWPDADRSSRVVIIADGLAERKIDELWAALTQVPVVDSPDLAALTEILWRPGRAVSSTDRSPPRRRQCGRRQPIVIRLALPPAAAVLVAIALSSTQVDEIDNLRPPPARRASAPGAADRAGRGGERAIRVGQLVPFALEQRAGERRRVERIVADRDAMANLGRQVVARRASGALASTRARRCRSPGSRRSGRSAPLRWPRPRRCAPRRRNA